MWKKPWNRLRLEMLAWKNKVWDLFVALEVDRISSVIPGHEPLHGELGGGRGH